MDKDKKIATIKVINLKLDKNVVEVLDDLVLTGLYKSRVNVILSALRNYEPFITTWKTHGM